jgi:hypothetical protein
VLDDEELLMVLVVVVLACEKLVDDRELKEAVDDGCDEELVRLEEVVDVVKGDGVATLLDETEVVEERVDELLEEETPG